MAKKNPKNDNAQQIVDAIIEGMQEKKAKNIVLIDLRNISNPLADFFVICSGSSDRQVDAISESVERFAYLKSGEDPWRTEGKNSFEWVILDYINVVAHIFTEKKREFYGLEELWGDGKIKVYEDLDEVKEINN